MADEMSGKIKHASGKIKEEVGEFLGDKRMRREGKLAQVEGEAEQDMDRAADAVEEAALRKNAARTARERNE